MPKIDTRAARARLLAQTKPHWQPLARGTAIGYRKGVTGAGTWNVRCADGKGSSWIQVIGLADDVEDADGQRVLSYMQAVDKARYLARGGDGADPYGGRRPITLEEAVADYKADLRARGQNPRNADNAIHHVPASLRVKPVSMLTARELQHWRNSLVGHMKVASANRRAGELKAALNLAAKLDPRITNVSAWRYGLSLLALPPAEESCNILTDVERAAVVAAAYRRSEDLGVFVELHDATGMRSSQIALIRIRDIKLGREPMLIVPSSLKGKNRTARRPIPLPVSAELAHRLATYAKGRRQDDFLLLYDGAPWNLYSGKHWWWMRDVFAKAGLDPDRHSLYSFRHTVITRALLANLPIRLVAAAYDTSIGQIEKTYSKWIVHQADDRLRSVMVGSGDDVASANGNNVVPIPHRRA